MHGPCKGAKQCCQAAEVLENWSVGRGGRQTGGRRERATPPIAQDSTPGAPLPDGF